jgi:glycosyltransferase involved in cell wall biosynthesis
MAYSSVPEVIGPGGLLAPVNHLVDNEYDHAWAAVDEKAFGDQVARLLDDSHLRTQLGRAAREHVRTSFDWAKAALQFGAIIRERQAVAA